MRRTVRSRKYYRTKSRKVYQRGGNLETWLDNLRNNPYFYKFLEEKQQKEYENFPILQIEDEIKLNTTPLNQIAAHLQFWFSKTDDIQVTNPKSFEAKLAKLMRQDFFTQNALPYIQTIEMDLRKLLDPMSYKTIYGTEKGTGPVSLEEKNYPLLIWGLLGSTAPEPIPILSDQSSVQV